MESLCFPPYPLPAGEQQSPDNLLCVSIWARPSMVLRQLKETLLALPKLPASSSAYNIPVLLGLTFIVLTPLLVFHKTHRVGPKCWREENHWLLQALNQIFPLLKDKQSCREGWIQKFGGASLVLLFGFLKGKYQIKAYETNPRKGWNE